MLKTDGNRYSRPMQSHDRKSAYLHDGQRAYLDGWDQLAQYRIRRREHRQGGSRTALKRFTWGLNVMRRHMERRMLGMVRCLLLPFLQSLDSAKEAVFFFFSFLFPPVKCTPSLLRLETMFCETMPTEDIRQVRGLREGVCFLRRLC
jgi:hypothetical protein